MVKVTERPEKVLEIAKFEAFAVAGSRQKSEKTCSGPILDEFFLFAGKQPLIHFALLAPESNAS